MSETTEAVAGTVSATTKPFNPFDYVANVLMVVRMKLEEPSEGDDIPRYARIAQIRKTEIEIFDTLAKGGVTGLTLTVTKLIHLTLTAKDLFSDLRSMKALIEVAGAMVKAVSNPEFTASIGVLFNETGGGGDDLREDINKITQNSAVSNFVNQVEAFMDFIPDPGDLRRIEYELFMMSRITYSNADLFHTGDGEGQPVLAETGKVHLLQWTFGNKWEINYQDGASKDAFHAGKRVPSSVKAADAKQVSYEEVLIYEYEADFSDDFTEIGEMFKALGYTQLGTNNQTNRNTIRTFQSANELPVTGILDNDVINRLHNLDYENEGLKWVVKKGTHKKPDEKRVDGWLPLVNGDANGYAVEGYDPILKGKYRHYIIGQDKTSRPEDDNSEKPEEFGWVSLPAPGKTIGFVAVEGRKRERNTFPFYEGGKYSEGPATCGKEFFFAAMHTQPWIAGRKGHPGASENLFGYTLANTASETQGLETKMYQKVNMGSIDPVAHSNAISGFEAGDYKLMITVRARQRFLFNEKAEMSVPDQGRVRVEVFKKDKTKPEGANDPSWWPQPKNYRDLALKRKQAIDNNQVFSHDKHNFWECLRTSVILDNTILENDPKSFVPADYEVKVTLEGKLNNNWDCDAYFTDVAIKWSFIPDSNT